jgi:hypothetical protein
MADTTPKDLERMARFAEFLIGMRASTQKSDRNLVSAPAVEECAWMDCHKPRRQKSKYCSRKCSNKNAHYNEKRRKAGLTL